MNSSLRIERDENLQKYSHGYALGNSEEVELKRQILGVDQARF